MSGHSWRRTRPFWGGLLTLLAGLELLSIPFATKALPLVIQSGTVGGTYLLALVLIIAGLLLWLQPGQRVFLGVMAVLVSIASFVYANLGGFLIGMLLGMVGGALAAAWTPDGQAPPDPPESGMTFTDRRVVGAGEHLDAGGSLDAGAPRMFIGRVRESPADESPADEGSVDEVPEEAGRDGEPGPAGRALAIAVLPALLLAGTAGMSGSLPTPSPTPSARPGLLPGVIDDLNGALGDLGVGSDAPAATPAATPNGRAPAAPEAPDASAGAGHAVATETAAVRAPSLTMTGMKFRGVVELPTANGSVKMLRFTMDRAVLDRPEQTMGPATLVGRTFTFEGDVVIYTTKMTGKLLGLPQEFTADHPNVLVRALKLVPSLSVPLTMTDIVSEQPYVTARSLHADGLHLVVGP